MDFVDNFFARWYTLHTIIFLEPTVKNERGIDGMRKTREAGTRSSFTFPPREKFSQRLLLFCLLFAVAVIAAVAAFVILPAADYAEAGKLLEAGENEAAMAAYARIYNYKDAAAQYSRAATETGDAYLSQGDRVKAAVYFTKAGRSLEAEQIFDFNTVVMGTSFVTAAIAQDGTSYYLSDREGDNRRAGADAVASYKSFLPHSVGVNGVDMFGFVCLHAPGGYGVTLSESKEAALTATSGVRDMVSMLTEDGYTGYTVVLLNNGTVRMFSDTAQPLSGVTGWKDIVSVKAGYRKIFAIDSAGRLRIAYESDYPEELRYDVTGWKDIQKVTETGKAIVGLTRDGRITVAYAGTDRRYNSSLTGISNATDIASNGSILLILRDNGCVKAIRVPNWSSDGESSADLLVDKAVAAVNAWTGVTRVRFAAKGIYGIRFNGTVRYVSCDIAYTSASKDFYYDTHSDFSAAVSQWADVVDVISCGTHAIAVTANGRLKAVGDGTYRESRVGSSGATDYIRRTGGTYLNVDDWQLW